MSQIALAKIAIGYCRLLHGIVIDICHIQSTCLEKITSLWAKRPIIILLSTEKNTRKKLN